MHYHITVSLFFMFCFLFYAWNEWFVLPGYAARDPSLLYRPASEGLWNALYAEVSLLLAGGACYSMASFIPQLETAIQLTKIESVVSGEGNPTEFEQIEVGSKIWRRRRKHG